MGVVRIISDLHLGHRNIALHRGFDTVEEHDKYIVDSWNSVVGKRDVVWILGDITMENSKHYYKLDLMNGLKRVILGNHDRPQDVSKLLSHVISVSGMVSKKGYILTHCPLHPRELKRFKKNIHGHVHENTLDDYRYLNVSAEVLGYKPMLFPE